MVLSERNGKTVSITLRSSCLLVVMRLSSRLLRENRLITKPILLLKFSFIAVFARSRVKLWELSLLPKLWHL